MQIPKAHPFVVLSAQTLLFVLFHNSRQSTVHAQSLPPAKLDGFIYKRCPDQPNTVLIEAFYDPVCPDSKDSWPPLKRAVDYYGSSVSLVVHLLPLPYHDNAFLLSRALHIANKLNASSTFPFMECIFRNQEKFYGDQTSDLSKNSIVRDLVKFAAESIGDTYYCKIESGFRDRQTDLKTRVSFKYSALRGVYGTPTFAVNGFMLPDTNLDYNGWRSLIDPLIIPHDHEAKSDNSLGCVL